MEVTTGHWCFPSLRAPRLEVSGNKVYIRVTDVIQDKEKSTQDKVLNTPCDARQPSYLLYSVQAMATESS